ncbi:Gfo/Idh/MocA family protein [Ammoniphilus resinae]|uniref:Dehydrogenase n=1 Tax=Ammoniphilus resinae TaxID=861532 RepID=A0ABS4GVB4_9BACL|nr:Gfo/Idh/MocA family oxidoreductase [Ammoniphilus resinae]MBP1933820.1 putative dehydrogenase [Ammoniphilus resinae]
MTIGIGVVGCGTISKAHFTAIKRIPQVKLVGITSKDLPKAKRAAEEYQCKVYQSVSELLLDPEIHMVTYLTPPGVHQELIIPTLESGKHILVEKPIGTDIGKIKVFLQKAKESDRVLSCISQHRFDPASQVVLAKLNQGVLGKMTGANCLVNWYREQSYYNPWRSSRSQAGGGVLAIQAYHTIDLMLWYMGEVASVKAYTDRIGHEGIDVEDIAMACIRFTNGTLGVISATTSAYPGYSAKLDIFGTQGSVTIEGDELTYYHSSIDQEKITAQAKGESVADPSQVSVDSILGQYQDVIRAIETGTQPLVTGEEAGKVYALIEAIYESSATGKEIKLN